ncbi:hypothetical protein CMUS01_09678 [Colletotrichum musicola]|uniref:Peptidase A1 domain-containing protein n=1 Tax=Colletotrichum musicola TaxID=2175873 RepID=A0A8H6K795_9PEZI|nr:hypothetical protein CMUS01_09678 [Colletotrichum musicola]
MLLAKSTFQGWGAFLLLLLVYTTTRAQAGCAPYPIAIRVGNVTLSNGKVARGAEIAIGEPKQTFPLMPDTYAHFPGDFPFNLIPWEADYSPDKPEKYMVEPITDMIRLNSNVTLDNFQMGIVRGEWNDLRSKPLMSFGLGTNSSLLRLLRSSGKISSRTWSFFWGRGFGMSSQQDGSLIFGGYDRAKVMGERYTTKFTPNHPNCSSQLVVNVTDLTVHLSDGRHASIFPSKPGHIMPTCISPSSPVLMALNLDPYFDNWMKETEHDITKMNNTFGYYFWNEKYRPEDEEYDGRLTISLSSGLNITISKDQLVVPEVTIDTRTGDLLVNSTERNMLVISLQDVNADDMPYLGFQFLAADYLQVNHDAGQFSLWRTNDTTDENLVAIDAADEEVSEVCTSPQNSAATDTSIGTNRGSVSTGTIAGIRIGAVVGVAIVVGLATWILTKKKSAAAMRAPDQSTSANDGKQDLTQNDTVPAVHEMGSEQHAHEMRGQSRSELA